jgi:hypothetical protein
MKIPKILTETPTMEHPTMGFPTRDHPLMGFPTMEHPAMEHPTTKNPLFDLPPAFLVDSDGDGVIDPWDCQPFNPNADGFLGTLVQKAKAFVKPDSGRAARRRATVRQTVSRGVSRGVSAARGGIRTAIRRAPIHVSRRRAAERRAGVVGRVKNIHKRLTTSRLPVRGGRVQPFEAYSHAAAAGRRQKIAGKLERVGSKLGVNFGRAADRRTGVQADMSGRLADVRDATKLQPAFEMRRLLQPIHPTRPQATRPQATRPQATRPQATRPQVQTQHERTYDLPEPDLDASEW